MRGRIVLLHLKPREGRARGLPKRAVPHLTITAEGVQGDFNRWRTEKANGDPEQAVLLLSEEILADLRAEGWPVQPGNASGIMLARSAFPSKRTADVATPSSARTTRSLSLSSVSISLRSTFCQAS